MTDKYTEALKKYLASFSPHDKPPTRQEIFEAAWNASHDHCAKICYDIGEKNIKEWRKNSKCSQYEQGLGDAPFDCEEAIKNDKVTE
jgi:hypothetical protein